MAVAHVVECARPVLTVHEDERRPGRAGQHRRRVEGDAQVQLGPAARDREAGGRRGPRLLDEALVDPHARPVDGRAVRGEEVARLVVEHVAADLAQQPKGGLVDLPARLCGEGCRMLRRSR